MAGHIVVKQVKGRAGTTHQQRAVLAALGLRGVGSVRAHKDNNCTRGMVNKLHHIISYELKEGAAPVRKDKAPPRGAKAKAAAKK